MAIYKIDLTNKVFGRWLVLSFSRTKETGSRLWICKCLCGTTKEVSYTSLVHGVSKSCGCLHKELASKANKTHGESKTRLYNIWFGMKKRIFNKKDGEYHNYGARGIKLHKEWIQFVPFRDWAIQNGYKDNLSIERKDPNKNYCPINCSWIPMNEQWKTKRNLILYKGETQKHAGLRLGGSPTLVRDRMKILKWSKKKAFTTLAL